MVISKKTHPPWRVNAEPIRRTFGEMLAKKFKRVDYSRRDGGNGEFRPSFLRPKVEAIANPDLRRILAALVRDRGEEDFVKQKGALSIDFYIHDIHMAVEIDEYQHFTSKRKLSLSKYQANGDYGVDLTKWVRLCDEIDCHDSHPPYRDWQRAYYDSVRDILIPAHGFPKVLRFLAWELADENALSRAMSQIEYCLKSTRTNRVHPI